MYNWSVDTRHLKKYPRHYTIWKLEQMLNWGLGGEKIEARLARKYWNRLFIDPIKKRYLEFLLWPRK